MEWRPVLDARTAQATTTLPLWSRDQARGEVSSRGVVRAHLGRSKPRPDCA